MTEPVVLYKYRSLSRDGSKDGRSPFEDTRDIFVNNRMWFATLKSCNDPFEGQVDPSLDATDEQKLRKFQDVPAWSGFVSSNPKAIALREIQEMEDGLRQRREQVKENFGCLSLSAKPDSLLMWAHYADSHRGICIELAPIRDGFVGRALPVHYSDDIPKVNFYTSNKFEIAKASILTKSTAWSYEEEYRLIEPSYGLKDMPKGQISGIIFGCHTSNDDKKEVREWLSSLKHHVNVYQACMNESSYSLEIKIDS